jgi:hypothetical protein
MLTSSANPSAVRQAVTFTATVTPAVGSAVPTGLVVFLNGTSVIGSATLDSTGHAALTTSTLAVGIHLLRAAYAGGSGFIGSTSPLHIQLVLPIGIWTAADSG